MSANAIRAGRAVVEIATNQSLFDKGLAAVKQKLQRLAVTAGSITKNIGTPMAAVGDGMNKFGSASMRAGAMLGGIGAAGAGTLGAIAKGFADAGGAIDDMAQRTGLSAQAIGRLSYAAKMSGTDIEAVEKAVRTMGKGLTAARSGNQEAVESFNRLGLSIAKLSALSPEQQFAAIADRIRKVRDPGERAAVAMQVFGKSGADLVPMLNQGSKGISDLMAEAEALGVVMGDKDVAAAAALGDKMDQIFAVVHSVTNAIGAGLSPVLIELGDAMIDGLKLARQFIVDFSPFFPLALKIAAAVAAAGAALVAMGGTLVGIGAALTAAGTLGAAMVATFAAVVSPIGLVIASVAALGGAILYYTGTGNAALTAMQQAWQKFSSWVAPVIEGVKNALMAGEWAKAGEILMLSLEIAFRTGVASLYAIWTDFQTSVLNAWTELPVRVLNGFDTMAANLRNVWGSVVTNLQNAFSTVIAWLRGAWDRTVNTIAKKLLYLYSLIDRSVDYEAAAKQMDREADQRAKQRQQDLDATTNARRTAMERDAQFTLAGSDARNAARSADAAAITGQRTEAANASKAAFGAKTQGLQVNLAGLIESAKPQQKPGASGLMTLLQNTPLGALTMGLGKMAMKAYDNIPSLAPSNANAKQSAAAMAPASGGIAGTFSSFAAGMVGNSSPLVGLVDTSKKQLAELQKITANTKNPFDPMQATS